MGNVVCYRFLDALLSLQVGSLCKLLKRKCEGLPEGRQTTKHRLFVPLNPLTFFVVAIKFVSFHKKYSNLLK